MPELTDPMGMPLASPHEQEEGVSQIPETTEEQPDLPTIGWEVSEELVNAIRDMTPHQLRPVSKRLWLQAIPPPSKSTGGLHLPQQDAENRNYGVVRAIAKDVTVAKVGDIVRCAEYTGEQVCYKGSDSDQYYLVEEDAVSAILDVELNEA